MACREESRPHHTSRTKREQGFSHPASCHSLPCVGGMGCRVPADDAGSSERVFRRAPPAREAERRKAPLRSPRLGPFGLRRARPQRRTRRLSALRRGDFGPRDRASGTRTAGSSPALSRGFRPARPVPSSPCGQPPVVGADGDPTPPGTVLARHGRGRRRPRSANMTPHESAL